MDWKPSAYFQWPFHILLQTSITETSHRRPGRFSLRRNGGKLMLTWSCGLVLSLPGSGFKKFLDLRFGYGQFIDMVVQPFRKIFFNLIGPPVIDLPRCVLLFAQALMTEHVAQSYDF